MDDYERYMDYVEKKKSVNLKHMDNDDNSISNESDV
jgi:hypothetical protein